MSSYDLHRFAIMQLSLGVGLGIDMIAIERDEFIHELQWRKPPVEPPPQIVVDGHAEAFIEAAHRLPRAPPDQRARLRYDAAQRKAPFAEAFHPYRNPRIGSLDVIPNLAIGCRGRRLELERRDEALQSPINQAVVAVEPANIVRP